jgi:protein SCO1/2
MDDKKIKIALGIVAVIVGVMIGVAVMITKGNYSHGPIPVIGQVTPFEFTERNGGVFGQKEMLGKITIVNFFYTSCPGPCPRMNAQVAELYRLYAGSNKIQFVSISVDPDRDSLSVLQRYAKNLGVNDQRWAFLRSSPKEVQQLSEQVFLLAGDTPTLHSTKLILVDDRAQIRGYYSSEEEASLKVLKKDIHELAEQIK